MSSHSLLLHTQNKAVLDKPRGRLCPTIPFTMSSSTVDDRICGPPRCEATGTVSGGVRSRVNVDGKHATEQQVRLLARIATTPKVPFLEATALPRDPPLQTTGNGQALTRFILPRFGP